MREMLLEELQIVSEVLPAELQAVSEVLLEVAGSEGGASGRVASKGIASSRVAGGEGALPGELQAARCFWQSCRR